MCATRMETTNCQLWRVIVDGYNVTKRHRDWSHLSLQQARQRLVVALTQAGWPVAVSEVEVIFDGATHGSGTARHNHVRVRFARDADAEICRTIRLSRVPERLVVISDDREILGTAKVYGTKRYSTVWLLDHLQRKLPSKLTMDERTALTEVSRRNINAELIARWKLHQTPPS